MKINNIAITNFRCFKSLNINFNSKMNVIIGNNGVGKTAILDAISVAMGGFFLGIDSVPANGIKKEDVRFLTKSVGSTIDRQPQYPVVIECNAELDNNATWVRELNTESGNTTYGKAEKIKAYAQNLQSKIRSGDPDTCLPIISYYGTGRLWAQKRKKQAEKGNKDRANRFLGYTDCLSAESNEKFMLDWFEKMTYVKLQEEKDVPELQAVLGAIEQCYLESGANVSDVKVQFSVKSGQLEITYKDNNNDICRHPFHELSAGYRNMLSLVADIAYRMAMLNPHLLGDVVKKTEGVVLIDEVDLHLHPIWQKRILSTLTSIFPKVQFIVTTHAPSVISSVKADELLILDGENLTSFGSEVYGKDVNSILSEIMGTSERPDEITKMFDDFRSLLDNGQYAEARVKLDELRSILGENDSEVISSAISLDFEDNWEN